MPDDADTLTPADPRDPLSSLGVDRRPRGFLPDRCPALGGLRDGGREKRAKKIWAFPGPAAVGRLSFALFGQSGDIG